MIAISSLDNNISEEQFLCEYDISAFEQPSVATDIAVFTVTHEESDNYRRNAQKKLSLLLIKRGEFPYKGHWALPGGFVKPNETLEQCALRETINETGIEPTEIMQVGTFSQPNRDPRGRIISAAFVSIIIGGSQCVHGGDDAVDAKWFDIELKPCLDEKCILILKSGDIELKAELKITSRKFGCIRYDVADNTEIAFDHASIIATALSVLRHAMRDFDILFDFFPKTFTLSELQNVYELITGDVIMSANFRRKIADYVEETEEFISGAGHRPAKLYKKKQRE